MNNNNDSINKARMAAEKAKEYAEHARQEEERENRNMREEARKNIPLVSPRRVNLGATEDNFKSRPNNAKRRSAATNRQDRRSAAGPESPKEPYGSTPGAGRQRPGGGGRRNSNQGNGYLDPEDAARRREAMRMTAGRRLREGQQYHDSPEFWQDDQDPQLAGYAAHDYDEDVSSNRFGYFLAVAVALLSVAIGVSMWLFNILPSTPRIIATGALLILTILMFVLASRGQVSRRTRRVGGVFGSIFLLLLGGISYLLFTGIGFLNSLHTSNEQVLFEVRVLTDSPLQSLEELDQMQIATTASEKEEDVLKALDSISKKNGVEIGNVTYESYVDLVNSLYSGESEVILFNNAKIDSIKEAFPDFETQTRVLGTEIVKVEISKLVKPVNTSKEPFNIYISGIDTYGEISTVSRSDVNIIMTVDPANKKILLTNIPRDTYVPIYNKNGSDKLTHAGIYGIESSIGTLSNFLDTEINYFVRVNFSSLIELVDVLGGIELENPEEFVTREGNGNYYFPQGTIYLNGEEALAYSRERYNIAEGDIGRGKNQLRVIEAMINKAISPEIITYADELMKRFNEVAETNMPAKDMSNLVNAQLSNNKSWNFETLSLRGTGRNDLPSQGMPGYALYMYDPDPASVAEIQQRIREVLGK